MGQNLSKKKICLKKMGAAEQKTENWNIFRSHVHFISSFDSRCTTSPCACLGRSVVKTGASLTKEAKKKEKKKEKDLTCEY